MQKQFEILNEICRLFYQNSNRFDKISYIYKFNPEENWIGTELSIFLNGESIDSGLTDEINDSINNLCQKLHDEMQTQTGGDWRKFILTIDEQGKAKTQFIYEIQSCMDEFND